MTAAPPDTFGARAPGYGRPTFGTENGAAVATYQRGDHEWSGNLLVVGGNLPALEAVGRQKGRQGVTLWVPAYVYPNGTQTPTPAGVVVGPSEGEILNAVASPPLSPGDSVFIPTEAPVWVGLIPGAAAGYVCVMVTYNPDGGGLGGQ
jgi:hypothetical protein